MESARLETADSAAALRCSRGWVKRFDILKLLGHESLELISRDHKQKTESGLASMSKLSLAEQPKQTIFNCTDLSGWQRVLWATVEKGNSVILSCVGGLAEVVCPMLEM